MNDEYPVIVNILGDVIAHYPLLIHRLSADCDGVHVTFVAPDTRVSVRLSYVAMLTSSKTENRAYVKDKINRAKGYKVL